ncbi:hypothetical protein LG293_17100 (plasmid) [Citricoccus nitrophenolicus]
MTTRLTAREAAELAGIEPSTFRAYVARGQAPDPDEIIGSSKIWHDSTIRQWRDLPSDADEDPSVEFNTRSSRLWSRGRRWEDSVRGDLVQLGLSWEDADSILHDRSVGGMSLDTYRDARHIVGLHKAARKKMRPDLPPVRDGRTAKSLVRQAAKRVATGQDFFAARVELAVELTSRGMAEILLPQRFDSKLWDAIESQDAKVIESYLLSAETSDFPTQARPFE